MNLLLNGCSFSANYYLANHLARQLGLQQAVSLAVGGSSNRRIVRTTLEYLQENSDVGFVLLGLSFHRRREGSFLPTGEWVQYGTNGLQGHFAPHDAVFKKDIPRAQIEQYVSDVYANDIDNHYIDQLLCDIILLTGYLESKNIPYLIFNFCELRYAEYSSKYYEYIRNNKRIVPLDTFVANLFLRDQGAKYAEPEERWPVNARHYNGDEYIHLNNYFINHLRTNNLL